MQPLTSSSKKVVTNFKQVLKDFEPMVKNPDFLRTGREIKNFSLRPREAWGNWLLCAVLQYAGNPTVTFAEDDVCDGIIVERSTGAHVYTEHVSVLDVPSKEAREKGEAAVIAAIQGKIDRGAEYAEGKYLIVFFEGVGEFYRNKIREAIRGKHHFEMVYGIGLLTSGQDGYLYAVTQFHDFHSVTYFVRIDKDFNSWSVSISEPGT